MNKFLLFLILLPKGLWRSLGADIAQLKAILKVRLMLDDRRPMTLGKQQPRKKPFKFMTVLSVFISAVIGFMYIFPLDLQDSFMGLWIYFSVFLVMLSIMLITDFSTVLFDSRDKTILLPRPINERTLLLSRLLHMFIYLFRIVFPMSLAGWIMFSFVKGWKAAVWFPFSIIMLTVVALFLVNACYLLVLRFSRPGKFKDVINYFQIVFSIMFFAFIYLMPRAVSNEGFVQLNHADFKWAVFTPTYWLAASWSWFEADTVWPFTKWVSILAVAGPALLVWLTVKYLSPSFAKRIGNIDVVDYEPAKELESSKPATTKGVKKESQFYLKLANLFNKDPLGKAGFSIAWLQTERSRNFKMRVYPTFAYVPVYFFFLITQSKQPVKEVFANMHNTSKHILLLYMTSFVVMQLLSMLVFSDQYKASWIYYSSPVERPGAVMGGAFKGIWVKYFVPMFLAVSIFVLYIWGLSSLFDIILAFVNITLFAMCIMRVAHRRLPFSAMEQMNEKGNRFFKTLFIMILPMGLGFGHWAVSNAANSLSWLLWLKVIFILLSSIMLWLLWDSYKSTNWNELKRVDLA